MDPRTAAKITAPDLQDAFAEGLAEGLRMARGEIEIRYRVFYCMDGNPLRVRDYEPSESAGMFSEIAEFIAHGPGVGIHIIVLDANDPPQDTHPELPGPNDVSD